MTGGYNYVQNVPIDQNMHQWLSRVDVNISNNTRLFARYNLQAEEQNFPVGLWWRNANQVPYPSEVTAPNRSHSGTVSLTKVFGNVADERVDIRRSRTSISPTSSAIPARSPARRSATRTPGFIRAVWTRFRR